MEIYSWVKRGEKTAKSYADSKQTIQQSSRTSLRTAITVFIYT